MREGGDRGDVDAFVVDELEVDCADVWQVEDDQESLGRQVDWGVELAQEVEAGWSLTGLGEVRGVEGDDDFGKCVGAEVGRGNLEIVKAVNEMQEQQELSGRGDDRSSDASGVRCSLEEENFPGKRAGEIGVVSVPLDVKGADVGGEGLAGWRKERADDHLQ